MGRFTAKRLKYDFCFKLGGEVSSFRHRNAPFSRLLLYHNLVLEGGPNFRWQYIIEVSQLFVSKQMAVGDLKNKPSIIIASKEEDAMIGIYTDPSQIHKGLTVSPTISMLASKESASIYVISNLPNPDGFVSMTLKSDEFGRQTPSITLSDSKGMKSISTDE